ncbi:MAG: hypothetical protein AVDCRST_MAG25-1117 [uncultured Rubrobacteraceae bacterium]|uniref:Uncharacterized protein n=1 Tax=uncultured Rubrobacteraceae bacterium TaxID=349277 RepID=A0A6J4RDL1_9ACTN|nr:MAG: hypothetical protein AVDCRST_MAG25-1117 [uncultured Rubrobacteraceae bacterium]
MNVAGTTLHDRRRKEDVAWTMATAVARSAKLSDLPSVLADV